MNTVRRRLIYLVVASLLPAGLAGGAEAEDQTPRKAPQAQAKLKNGSPRDQKAITFNKPPSGVGKPKRNISGAVRTPGDEQSLPDVFPLVPVEPGLSVAASPSIYWYLSAPTPARVKLTLVRCDSYETWFVINLLGPKTAGIHELNLAEHGVALEPNVDYRFTVAIVPGARRFKNGDPIGQGYIRYVKPSAELSAALAKADEVDKPIILAEHGIWYDALKAMGDQIKAHPDDPNLRRTRAQLLGQEAFVVKVTVDPQKGPHEVFGPPPKDDAKAIGPDKDK